MEHLLLVKNLSYFINNKIILDNITIQFKRGKNYAIIGPNGAGKTTLIKIIAGLIRKNISGKILFEGKDISKLPAWLRYKKGIAITFQEYPEYDFVPENIFFIKTEYLEKLKIKDLVKKKMFKEMSFGEKKRLDLAIVLSHNPKIIFFDELDSGTDVDSLKIITQVLKDFQKEFNSTFVFVSHTFKILEYFKIEKIYLIIKGKIVKEGDISLLDKVEKYGYEHFWKNKNS